MVYENYSSLVKKYTYLFLAFATISSVYIFTHYPEINQGETILKYSINATIRITSSYSWVLFFFGLSAEPPPCKPLKARSSIEAF